VLACGGRTIDVAGALSFKIRTPFTDKGRWLGCLGDSGNNEQSSARVSGEGVRREDARLAGSGARAAPRFPSRRVLLRPRGPAARRRREPAGSTRIKTRLLLRPKHSAATRRHALRSTARLRERPRQSLAALLLRLFEHLRVFGPPVVAASFAGSAGEPPPIRRPVGPSAGSCGFYLRPATTAGVGRAADGRVVRIRALHPSLQAPPLILPRDGETARLLCDCAFRRF